MHWALGHFILFPQAYKRGSQIYLMRKLLFLTKTHLYINMNKLYGKLRLKFVERKVIFLLV